MRFCAAARMGLARASLSRRGCGAGSWMRTASPFWIWAAVSLSTNNAWGMGVEDDDAVVGLLGWEAVLFVSAMTTTTPSTTICPFDGNLFVDDVVEVADCCGLLGVCKLNTRWISRQVGARDSVDCGVERACFVCGRTVQT